MTFQIGGRFCKKKGSPRLFPRLNQVGDYVGTRKIYIWREDTLLRISTYTYIIVEHAFHFGGKDSSPWLKLQKIGAPQLPAICKGLPSLQT